MTRRNPAVLLLLCTLSIARCLKGDAAQVRDSAGIQIVMNISPSWLPAETLRLGKTPLLVIGTRPGTMYELSRVAGAVRLTSRHIVVGDGASRQLRFYDSLGTFISSVGRQGNGPGEFQGLSKLQAIGGDTLVAGSDLRLSLFTGTGRAIRSIDPLAPPAQLPPGNQMILTAFSSGTTIIGSEPHWRESNHPPQTGRRWTDSIHVGVFGEGNKLLTSLGRLPARVMEWRGFDLMLPTFSSELLVASAGQFSYLGFGSEYSIRVYSSSGRLERIIRRAWVPERVDIDAWATQWVKNADKLTAAEADAKRKELRERPYAATVPAFAQLLADRAGRLWVRESHLASFSWLRDPPFVASVWNVFSSAGKWLGNVEMPAQFLPTDIGSDYVLGVARDHDGVETVVLYRLGVR